MNRAALRYLTREDPAMILALSWQRMNLEAQKSKGQHPNDKDQEKELPFVPLATSKRQNMAFRQNCKCLIEPTIDTVSVPIVLSMSKTLQKRNETQTDTQIRNLARTLALPPERCGTWVSSFFCFRLGSKAKAEKHQRHLKLSETLHLLNHLLNNNAATKSRGKAKADFEVIN